MACAPVAVAAAGNGLLLTSTFSRYFSGPAFQGLLCFCLGAALLGPMYAVYMHPLRTRWTDGKPPLASGHRLVVLLMLNLCILIASFMTWAILASTSGV